MRRATGAVLLALAGALGVFGPWKVATGAVRTRETGVGATMSLVGWCCLLLLGAVAVLGVMAVRGGQRERRRLDATILAVGPIGIVACGWAAFSVSRWGSGVAALDTLGVHVRPGWGVFLCVAAFTAMTSMAVAARLRLLADA